MSTKYSSPRFPTNENYYFSQKFGLSSDENFRFSISFTHIDVVVSEEIFHSSLRFAKQKVFLIKLVMKRIELY
jgi:hypothetical protein